VRSFGVVIMRTVFGLFVFLVSALLDHDINTKNAQSQHIRVRKSSSPSLTELPTDTISTSLLVARRATF
jgi:hypothetical protein